MAKVPYGVETLPKISIVWVGRTNVTDDRRQTDGRWHIANVNLSSRSLKKTYLLSSSILHRFQVMVVGRLLVKFSLAIGGASLLSLTPYPCKYTDKLYLLIVLPDADNHTIVSSFVWTQYRNVKEWQTDRRTGRIAIHPTTSDPDAIIGNLFLSKQETHQEMR